MQSYNYKNGTLEACEDDLPIAPFYRYGSGDGIESRKTVEAYREALVKRGFPKEGTRHTCCLGEMTIYARDHKIVPKDRITKGFEHNFLCVIKTGGSYIRVWVQDFNDLLLFMREIDGKPQDDTLQDLLDFVKSNNLQGFLSSVSTAMEFLANDNISIEVRSPKPTARG